MKLSIIIPVYNEINCLERFTNNLMDSFSDQNVEYIFVNDGSTDGSTKWLINYKKNYLSKHPNANFILINLKDNRGKGFALRKGLESADGDYILFQDSDLELNPKDSLEMFDIIKENTEMKVLFGSRFISGKLRSNKNFLNELIVKLNSIIFNILYRQSISDLHCGTKIISKEVINKIKLTIKDFGIEIDIASQIAKNQFQIYEYGISYFSRTTLEGKKITWIDGILSYFYLFRTRFIDNDISILLSILYSIIYMVFIATYFGMGIGKSIIIFIFLIIGCFIGLYIINYLHLH